MGCDKFRISGATILLVVFLVQILFAQSAPQPRPRASDTQPEADWMAQAPETQSVLLQIDTDPSNSERRLESQALVSLLKSTALSDPALEKVLRTAGAEARRYVTIDANTSGSRFVQLSVVLRPNSPGIQPDSAKQILQELCKRAQAALEQSSKAAAAGYEARRASLEADLAAAKARYAEVSTQLRVARASNPGAQYGGGDIRYQASNLIQQKQQIEATLAGTLARLRSLTESAPAMPATGASPSPSTSFSHLIDLRSKRLEDVKTRAAQGQASASDVLAAETDLAETRAISEFLAANVRLAPFWNGASGGEMASLRASIAENEARLSVLNDQIAKVSPATTAPSAESISPEQISHLMNDENRARSEVDNIQLQLSELRRIGRPALPPVLTVLDGNVTR